MLLEVLGIEWICTLWDSPTKTIDESEPVPDMLDLEGKFRPGANKLYFFQKLGFLNLYGGGGFCNKIYVF